MKSSPIHIWHHCHSCGMAPIEGERFHCRTCPIGPDTDLCSACYREHMQGRRQHGAASRVGTEQHHFVRCDGPSPEQLLPWLEPACIRSSPVHIGSGFVVRPEFRCGRASSFGAFGFLTQVFGRRVLLTALHVMDEVIKGAGIDATADSHSYTGTELPALVDSLRLYDAFARNWMLTPLSEAGPMIVLPNARIDDPEPVACRDIAAFFAPSNSQLRPRALARRPPVRGESMWLIAPMRNGSRARQAICVESTDSSLVFRYEEEAAMPDYTSGAAVIDGDGLVVGINTGVGRFAGREFGHAHPVASIHAHLERALVDGPEAFERSGQRA
jgi:hypothetical protein